MSAEPRFVAADQYHAIVKALKDDQFNVCIDVTAVDYLGNDTRVLPAEIGPERFEVVTNLLSTSKQERVRIRVQIAENSPICDSICDLYPGAEAMEREAFDLLGIYFRNHPDLTRILMPEDWEGHPLRKDYEQGRIPVQFKHPEPTR